MTDWRSLPTLADAPRRATAKPAKGTALIERKERRRDRRQSEADQKAEARTRDSARCRLPHCPYCQEYGKSQLVPQVAHVIQAKGQGGDPEGIRSTADKLMVLDPLAHAAQERHEWDVEPLTEKGTNGVCAFYLLEDVYDKDTGTFSTVRLLWARETAIHVPEHPLPLVKRKPIRQKRERD